MGKVLAFYVEEGVIIGDAEEQMNSSFVVTNPVIVIPNDRNLSFIPILGMMEENSIRLYTDNFRYGQPFTPTVDIRNHYNKMFGTGIVEATLSPTGGILLS